MGGKNYVAKVENIVIENQHHRAVLLLNEGHAGDETTLDALARGWQDVLDAAEQYPAETIPNAKPLIIEDAIQRETWPLIGHYPHPTLERTALCGIKIIGCYNDGSDELAICKDCQALHAAGHAAPLPE